MKSFVPLLLALAAAPACAQNSSQFRIDTTVTTYVVMEQGDVTPDGNVWAILNAETSTVLWKGTAAGEPLLATTLDSADHETYLAALPDGGCLLAAKLPSIIVSSGAPIDTFRVSFAVTALHADGQLNWRRKVITDLRAGNVEDSGFRVLRPRPTADGNVYILADIALGSIAITTPCVYKFSPEGELLWSRKFGAPYLNSYLRWG